MATVDEESENYYIASTLIKDIGTRLLLKILKNEIKRFTLDQFLGKPDIKTKLEQLKLRGVLNNKQYSIISLVPVPEDKLDISIIVLLLLNVCPNVVPPGKRWDNDPHDNDLSLVADLNRLRNFRNDLSHVSWAKLSNTVFNNLWEKVKEMLIRRSCEIGETGEVEKEINDLHIMKGKLNLDPSKLQDKCEEFMEGWKKWREEDERMKEDIKEMLTSVGSSIESLHEKFDKFNEHKRLNEASNQPADGTADSSSPINLKWLLNQDGEYNTETKQLKMAVLSAKNRGDNVNQKDLIVADETAYAKVIAYNKRNFPQLAENKTVFVTNIIKKRNGTLVFTSNTRVFSTNPPMNVPEEIRQAALAEWVTVAAAYKSEINTILSVRGKVVRTEPKCKKRVKPNYDKDVPFKRFKIKDQSRTMEVALWDDAADEKVEKGDVVQLKDFRRTSRPGKTENNPVPVIGTQMYSRSSIQVITDPNSEDDVSSECSDFEEMGSPKKSGKLEGLEKIEAYKYCANSKCSKKKLKEPDLKCPTCSTQYTASSAETGYYVWLLIRSDDDKDDQMTRYTVFKDVLTRFLKSADILTKYEPIPENTHEIMSKIIKKIPIDVNFTKVLDSEKLTFLEAIAFSD